MLYNIYMYKHLEFHTNHISPAQVWFTWIWHLLCSNVCILLNCLNNNILENISIHALFNILTVSLRYVTKYKGQLKISTMNFAFVQRDLLYKENTPVKEFQKIKIKILFKRIGTYINIITLNMKSLTILNKIIRTSNRYLYNINRRMYYHLDAFKSFRNK